MGPVETSFVPLEATPNNQEIREEWRICAAFKNPFGFASSLRHLAFKLRSWCATVTAIMAEKNTIQKKEEQISPDLKEFIDRVIVPILVQEYLKKLRQHAVSASPNENPDSTPDAGDR
jgi:hypothetical protein